MAFLNKVLDLASVVALTLASIFLLIMLSINGVNIVWRGLFDQAFSLVYPWTMLLFNWVILLGLYSVIRNNRDVVVDFIVVRLPYLVRLCLSLAVDTVGVVLFTVTFVAAFDLMQFQVGRMDMIDLPREVRTFPIILTSGLLVVHFVVHAIGLLVGHERPFAAKS